MLDSKRAQIGETMTWVVATLVIVVVLLISISLSIDIGDDKKALLIDKKKDFIATMSITNFFNEAGNVESLEKTLVDENDKYVEGQIKRLLEILSTPIDGGLGSIGAWNFQLYTLEGPQKNFIVFDFRPLYIPLGVNVESFETRILFKDKLNLRFWNMCEGKCE